MIYVYAFLPAADLARSPEAPPEPVRFLAHGDLVVAAAEVGSAPAPELDALRRHDTAVRAAAAGAAAVLPARFGSVFGTETDLLRWLQPRRPRILEALRQVQGCEQMTLRAFSEPATAPARPAPEGDGRANEPAPLGVGAGPGTRYLAEKRRARAGGTSPDVDALRRALEPLVCGERLERHDAPPLLATLHHLVRRGQTADYRTAVERAQEALAALRIAVTGPWPPYAFVPEGLS